ncbi:MAG TPA: hypothetical protein P5216_02780, partial [Bacteroidota bacterium]|nr:hypothetical protein [Bacteroidota bacterium]
MKKIFFQCLLIAIISSNLPAYSELVNISVGPQYTNKVWYDLTSQTQTTRGRDGFETEGDFGWGSYDMNTLAIVGDKLYIYRSVEGKYYIFTIQDLISGTYTFKYRLLNSSNAITREFAKSS